MSMNVKHRSVGFVGVLASAALLAVWGMVEISFLAAVTALSLPVLVAMFDISARERLKARPRRPAKGADADGRANGSLIHDGAAMPTRVAGASSVLASLLSLTLLAAGSALCAEASAAENIVVARGDGIALASACWDGQYMLLVTNRPETEPWKKSLRATSETDRIAVALHYRDTAAGNEWPVYRISGVSDAWSIPNARTFTGTLEVVSVPQDLSLRIWLPGEDRSGLGRVIRATQEIVARMWLNALTCRATKQSVRR